VAHETGQADGVFGRLGTPRIAALAFMVALLGCAKKGSPEAVADGFVDAYFLHMDQERAKEFTALGATEMMDKELRDVAQIRKDGYSPADAAPDMSVKRGPASPRDQRIRFPYEIHVRSGGAPEVVRDADIELAQIDGTWKVVRVALHQR
jgi:hypothetical protein